MNRALHNHDPSGFGLSVSSTAASVRPEPGSNSPLMSTKTPPAHKGHQIRHHEQSRKETIHLNQRNHPRDNPTTHHTGRPPSHPADEVKLGIDFWHAVEFSRSGRTPTNRLSAARRGNPSSLGQRAREGQIAWTRGISACRGASLGGVAPAASSSLPCPGPTRSAAARIAVAVPWTCAGPTSAACEHGAMDTRRW